MQTLYTVHSTLYTVHCSLYTVPDLQKERNLGVLRQCFLAPPHTLLDQYQKAHFYTQWATKERNKAKAISAELFELNLKVNDTPWKSFKKSGEKRNKEKQRKEEKNQEQTVITEKKQAKIWKNIKKQEEEKKKETRRIKKK